MYKWLKNKYKKTKGKVLSLVLSWYLPGRFDEQQVYILTSSPRSGSTLLGQVLDVLPNSCTLFEPLQLKRVPEAKAAGFSWRTDIAPEKKWDSGEAFFKRIFAGRVINSWTTSEMTFSKAIKSNRMIIKFVRANRLLPWICHWFNVPAPILLLRHPCAVVASQLNFGWGNVDRPEIPEYIQHYPQFKRIIEDANSDIEFLTIQWALDQLPALLTPHPHPWLIVTYEELILRPSEVLSRIVGKWNVEINMNEALSKLRKPSSVVSQSGISGVSGWKNKLTNEDINKILFLVKAFGISFYSQNDEADYEKLYDAKLSLHIKNVGIA